MSENSNDKKFSMPKLTPVKVQKPDMSTDHSVTGVHKSPLSSYEFNKEKVLKATAGAISPTIFAVNVVNSIELPFSGGSDEAAPVAAGGGAAITAKPAAEGSKLQVIQVSKPTIVSTAVQQTSKHFDIVLAIDIHFTQIPISPVPLPLPHPFIGVIFDPMDYIKINIPVPSFLQTAFSLPKSIPLGGSIKVQGKRKATTTTSVIGVAIPGEHATGLIPVYKIVVASLAPHDGEVYIGSKTVLGQGAEMSGCFAQQVLTCMDPPFGTQMLPTMPNEPKGFLSYLAFYSNFSSMYIQISSGKPVLVGGSFVPHKYTLGEMVMRFAAMFLMKKLMKGLKFAGCKLNGLLKDVFGEGNMISKILSRLGLDPVNFVTGALSFEWKDFEISGDTPLCWESTWYSDKKTPMGMLGQHVFNKYDLYILPDYEKGIAAWISPDERAPMPLPIPGVGDEPLYYRTCKIWIGRPDENTWIITNGSDRYTYRSMPHAAWPTALKVVSIDYANGTSLSFKYRGEHNLLCLLTDNHGRKIELTPDASGKRVKEVYYVFDSIRKKEAEYQYDDSGNLTHIWDAYGKCIQLFYNSRHLITKRINRNNMEYVFEYDDKGRVTYTTGLKQFQEGRLKFFPEKGCTEIHYPMQPGKVETCYYDEYDRIYKTVDANGAETWYDYTPHNEYKMIQSPEGRTQGYDYDEQGNMIAYHTRDGETYQYQYNKNNQLEARFAPGGGSEHWLYDDMGRLLQYTDPAGATVNFTYEGNRRKASFIKDSRGNTATCMYNAFGQLVRLTNQYGEVKRWVYDLYGRLTTFFPKDSLRISWQRDELGRVIRYEQTGEKTLQIAYDAYDLPVHVTDDQIECFLEYTPMGSLKKQVMQCLHGDKKTESLEFVYNAYETLMAVVNEKGERYRFTRDKNDAIIAETGFDGMVKKHYRDRDGLITKTLLPDDKYVNYAYDLAGRLSQTRYSDGSSEYYLYNEQGLLIQAENEHATVSFRRNALGQVVTEQQGEHTVNYAYQADGLLAQINSSLGAQTSYTYDDLGRLAGIEAAGNAANTPAWQAGFQYNTNHQVTHRQYTGGVQSIFEYDHVGRPISQKITSDQKTLSHKSYTWASGLKLVETLNRLTDGQVRYYYDDYGSLAAAVYENNERQLKNPDITGNLYETKARTDRQYDKGGKLIKDKNWYYAYDAAGNLALKSRRNISGKQGPQQQAEKKEDIYKIKPLAGWSLQNNDWEDETTLQDNTLGGTPAPARWQDGDWAYWWYANGMLQSVRRPDGGIVSFEYDALGRRTAKIFNKQITRYIWDGNVLLHEWSYALENRPKLVIDESGSLKYDRAEPVENLVTWVYEGGNFTPIAKLLNNERFSIVSDYLGTPIQAFDTNGNLVWKRELDIYGKIRKLKGNKTLIPFLYQGQYYDEEIELAYNRFRYYDCESGAFVSSDPVGITGGLNTYAYVHDPNSWIDPFGLTGTYMFTNGKKWYIGKGPVDRMYESMRIRVGGKGNVTQGIHMDFGDDKTGLMVEAELMRRNNAVNSVDYDNAINSPGEKMLKDAELNNRTLYDNIMKEADDFETKFNNTKGIKCH